MAERYKGNSQVPGMGQTSIDRKKMRGKQLNRNQFTACLMTFERFFSVQSAS